MKLTPEARAKFDEIYDAMSSGALDSFREEFPELVADVWFLAETIQNTLQGYNKPMRFLVTMTIASLDNIGVRARVCDSIEEAAKIDVHWDSETVHVFRLADNGWTGPLSESQQEEYDSYFDV